MTDDEPGAIPAFFTNLEERMKVKEILETLNDMEWVYEGDKDQLTLIAAIKHLLKRNEELERRIGEFEHKLDKTIRAADRAAHEASCLANGIIPD